MKIPKATKLPSGNWNINMMVDRQRISITAATRKEVERQAAEYFAAYPKDGAKVEKAQKKETLTLTSAIDEYIKSKSAVLSPATVRGYRTVQKNRFAGLMDRDVRGITKMDVQIAVNAEARKVSAKTVANAYGLVRPVLKECGVDVFGVRLPQVQKPVKRYLQPKDIGKLAQAVQGDSCEVPILLAVWLGLRRSEIAGLCWDCVDMDNSLLHIRRAVVPDEHNKWVQKNTAKNLSSQRTVDCPDYIMDRIRELPHRSDGRLFPMHPDTIRKHVHRACAAAGITDTTVHGLRHTNAAVMKAAGIDDRYAMERGGWSCESTYRKTYSYVFDSDKVDANKAINEYFTAKITDKITDEKEDTTE